MLATNRDPCVHVCGLSPMEAALAGQLKLTALADELVVRHGESNKPLLPWISMGRSPSPACDVNLSGARKAVQSNSDLGQIRARGRPVGTVEVRAERKHAGVASNTSAVQG